MDGSADAQSRWQERPVLAFVVRAVGIVAPLIAALAITVVLGRVIPTPGDIVPFIGRILLMAVASTATILVVERAARRLLPLAALLRLSMAFPDRAPSRYAVARLSGRTTDLERQVRAAREAGESTEALPAESILSLVTALSVHDRRTRGHSERVRVFTDMVAEEMRIPPADRDKLRWAALLHDVGKLVVEPDVLNKPGRPDEHEWEMLRRHPSEGAKVVRSLVPWLGPWAEAVEHHHERWDGSGYPHGLQGEQISLAGRVVAVADSFETMTAVRAYKRAMSVPEARRELAGDAGSHFDPRVVRAFLNIGIGKLRRTLGPVAWLASLPLAEGLRLPVEIAARGASALGQQAAGVATAAAVTVPIVAGAVATSVEPPPVSRAPAVAIASPRPTSRTAIPIVSPEATVLPDPRATAEPSPSPTRRPAETPGPATPTARSATPTARSATPTPRPATPTPRPATPTPRPATPTPPSAADPSYFLGATGTGNTTSSTVLPLRTAAPTRTTLPNYDTDRDDDPGLMIKKGAIAADEADPEKIQIWSARASDPIRLAGSYELLLWSAAKDFEQGKRLQVRAYLTVCPQDIRTCSLAAQAVLNLPDWSGGQTGFVERVLSFGTIDVTVPAGQYLAVKVVVHPESQDDAWFAYDTASYPSVLRKSG